MEGEMERDLYVLYSLWIWKLKREKGEKEERKIESRKVEIWWKDLEKERKGKKNGKEKLRDYMYKLLN